MLLYKRIKKVFVVSLLLVGIVVTSSSASNEELVGTIKSVNEQAHQLVIDEIQSATSKETKRLVTLQLPNYMVFLRPNGRMLPGWARVGKKIGVFGEFVDEDRQHFAVTMVNHHFTGHGHDSTGVRNRIGRGCMRQFQERPPEKSPPESHGEQQ